MTAQLAEAETLATMDASVKEHPSLAEALVAAQKDMPPVEPDAENPAFHSKFVSLGKLVSSVRPVLNRHGIALTQMPSQDEAGKPTLITRLVHTSGELTESEMPLMMEKSNAQGLGSALTYAKRYALGAALAIVDQEDDDGNAATAQGQTLPPATGAQQSALKAALLSLVGPQAEAAWNDIKATFGGQLYGPACDAIAGVVEMHREGQGSGQGTGAGSGGEGDSPSERPASAPSPDSPPAESIDADHPPDTEGL